MTDRYVCNTSFLKCKVVWFYEVFLPVVHTIDGGLFDPLCFDFSQLYLSKLAHNKYRLLNPKTLHTLGYLGEETATAPPETSIPPIRAPSYRFSSEKNSSGRLSLLFSATIKYIPKVGIEKTQAPFFHRNTSDQDFGRGKKRVGKVAKLPHLDVGSPNRGLGWET